MRNTHYTGGRTVLCGLVVIGGIVVWAGGVGQGNVFAASRPESPPSIQSAGQTSSDQEREKDVEEFLQWFVDMIRSGGSTEEEKNLRQMFWDGMLFRGFTDEQLRTIRQDLKTAFDTAERLANEGRYAEAFRQLFDAEYKQLRVRELLMWQYSDRHQLDRLDDDFPLSAFEKIDTVLAQILHTDQSPLMQWLRDPMVSFSERHAAIEELKSLAEQSEPGGEEVSFRGRYQGTLVQLATSPQLTVAERREVVGKLGGMIQDEYLSDKEVQQIRDTIAQSQKAAEQHFQARQYADAFVRITQAEQLDDLYHISDERLSKQKYRLERAMLEVESPVMQYFKNPHVPFEKKRALRSALWTYKSSGDLVFSFDGTVYDDPLVQVLRHPQINNYLKVSLLERIELMIKEKQYSPDYK